MWDLMLPNPGKPKPHDLSHSRCTFNLSQEHPNPLVEIVAIQHEHDHQQVTNPSPDPTYTCSNVDRSTKICSNIDRLVRIYPNLNTSISDYYFHKVP